VSSPSAALQTLGKGVYTGLEPFFSCRNLAPSVTGDIHYPAPSPAFSPLRKFRLVPVRANRAHGWALSIYPLCTTRDLILRPLCDLRGPLRVEHHGPSEFFVPPIPSAGRATSSGFFDQGGVVLLPSQMQSAASSGQYRVPRNVTNYAFQPLLQKPPSVLRLSLS